MPRRPSPALLALVPLFALAACGPSVDPAVKADLDRRVAQLPTSEETYPPSESYLPMAFVIGQWTQHRVRDDKGGVQLLTHKLVGQDNGGYWLETVTDTYAGREIAKMHVFMLGGREPSGMEIRALRVKQGDAAPTDLDPTDPVVREKYHRALDLLAVSFETEFKDDARVPGGHFIGCYKFQSGGPWGPWQKPSVVCVHPAVPLSGVVRAQPEGGGAVLELVGFGSTGAEAEL